MFFVFSPPFLNATSLPPSATFRSSSIIDDPRRPFFPSTFSRSTRLAVYHSRKMKRPFRNPHQFVKKKLDFVPFFHHLLPARPRQRFFRSELSGLFLLVFLILPFLTPKRTCLAKLARSSPNFFFPLFHPPPPPSAHRPPSSLSPPFLFFISCCVFLDAQEGRKEISVEDDGSALVLQEVD